MSNDEIKDVIKNGFKEFASVLKEASSSCENNTSSSYKNVTPTKQPVINTHTANNQLVPVNRFIPVTDTPSTNNFADYLYRALRHVPSSINLESECSAHNIQVYQLSPDMYVATLYKRDATVDITNSKFLHELRPWLLNSLATVRNRAYKDCDAAYRDYKKSSTNIYELYIDYINNCPDQQNVFLVQYQNRCQNLLERYNAEVDSLLHLLCKVDVMNLTDFGSTVKVTFKVLTD